MIHRQARSPAWVAWLAAFVCFYLLLCIGYLLAVPLCLSFCGRYPSLGVRIAIYIGCMLVNAAWSYAVSRNLYRTLRWTTFADGIPRCVSCGYNLTGNVSGVCPECGTGFSDTRRPPSMTDQDGGADSHLTPNSRRNT